MISEAGRGQLSHQTQIAIPAGETQATLTVTVADDDIIEAETDYTISLSATGHTALEPDKLTVTVPADGGDTQAIGDLDDTAVTVANADGAVAENPSAGAEVGIIVYADKASSYALTDDAEGRFAVSSTGLVTVADGGKLNFEDATTHGIIVQATLNDNSMATASFTIAVTNINEIALRDRDGRSNVVAASTGAVVLGLTLEAAHGDAIPIAAWELRQTVGLFELTRPEGSSTQGLRIKADAESLSSHIGAATELSVIARTEYDAATEVLTIRITEQEVVLVGELEDIDSAADEVAENSPEGATVGIAIRADNAAAYALTDDAGGRFAVSSTGLVTVADGAKLNFEGAATHSITVEARSANDRRGMRFAIDVINVDEIALRDGDGRSNVVAASAGAVVLGLTLEAAHSDAIPIAAWELRQTVGLFELTRPEGSSTQGLRIKADAESLSSHIGAATELSVIARTEHDAATEVFTIRITEQQIALVGELEDIDSAADEVAENSPEGATVGIAIRADNAATYTSTDDAGGRFAISSTGLVTVADGAKLNFEGAATHSITVEARSANDRRGMRFAIAVINVNEITLEDTDNADNIALASTGAVVLGLTLEAVHADNAPIMSWEIAAPSTAADLFEFSEPEESTIQTLRIKADANINPMTSSAVTLSLSVRTASDEAGEDFDIQIRPSQADGIRP